MAGITASARSVLRSPSMLAACTFRSSSLNINKPSATGSSLPSGFNKPLSAKAASIFFFFACSSSLACLCLSFIRASFSGSRSFTSPASRISRAVSSFPCISPSFFPSRPVDSAKKRNPLGFSALYWPNTTGSAANAAPAKRSLA